MKKLMFWNNATASICTILFFIGVKLGYRPDVAMVFSFAVSTAAMMVITWNETMDYTALAFNKQGMQPTRPAVIKTIVITTVISFPVVVIAFEIIAMIIDACFKTGPVIAHAVTIFGCFVLIAVKQNKIFKELTQP